MGAVLDGASGIARAAMGTARATTAVKRSIVDSIEFDRLAEDVDFANDGSLLGVLLGSLLGLPGSL